MPLKSALLRDFGGCCFCNTIRACFLWLLEVTDRCKICTELLRIKRRKVLSVHCNRRMYKILFQRDVQ